MICKKCGGFFVAIPAIFEYCPDCAEKLGIICPKCGKWDCNCPKGVKIELKE
jgi:hypothetical protein